ncbi:lactoylglutathione lyase [Acetobacterium woodii]|uniref:Aldoketomutase n=1 Tax=Acetobacterium woodii (strain ATCC 29683 / DSM 1030 / JCM 2381 / KCTC 1655 / WB1) TaxID=931626 RepID=H6LJV7_ACEWD|nr:VOC family protein [Acetobacterium woodii]AFA48711.1 lactoylglutathione lyase GloA [Acetobacterium woodii DSM 1030]
MNTYKMAHTMIRVLDLERSIRFYDEALGFKEIRRRDNPEYKFTLVFLTAGNPEGHQLELTYNYGQDVPYDLGNGYGHLAVSVNDLEASRSAHEAKGYDPTPLKGLSSDGKPHYYFISDPDGYKIEIIGN